MVKFSLARGECLTLTLSLGLLPANIAISDISLKTRFFGLHFCCRKYRCIFNHSNVMCQKSYQMDEITQRLGLLFRSRSFKVTKFGTNQKLTCDFLLVIITILPPILHHFRDIAFDRSKIAIYWPPLVFNPSPPSDGGVPLGRSAWNLPWMSMDGQRTEWRRNIAEHFSRLSKAHEFYRRQTDRQTDRVMTSLKNKEVAAVTANSSSGNSGSSNSIDPY